MAKNNRVIALKLDRAQFEQFLTDAPANGLTVTPQGKDVGTAKIVEHKIELKYAYTDGVLVVEGVDKPWIVPWSKVGAELAKKAKAANLEILA